MSQLELCFTSAEGFELYKTAFRSEGGAVSLVTVRGNTQVSSNNSGTFHWSPAVQALTVLLLRYIVDPAAALEGEGGSPASSLDYAISKQPLWVLDMFGMTGKGESNLKRLVKRINPNRKRPGPVKLLLNRTLIAPNDITVKVNDVQLSNPDELIRMAAAIEQCINGRERRRIPSPSRESSSPEIGPLQGQGVANGTLSFRELLRRIFFREIQQMLKVTDVFNPIRYEALRREAVDNPSFIRLAGSSRNIVGEVESTLMAADRLGGAGNDSETRSALCQANPIRVALPPAHAGTMAILTYLRRVKGYNVEADYRYAHSVELLRRISESRFSKAPDLCALTIATAANLLGGGKATSYEPYMVMPRLSHGILVPSAGAGLIDPSYGQYLFMVDIPATEAFYFDDLERRGKVNRVKVEVRHVEPDEISLLLAEGDPNIRAICGFPYYHLNAALNGCTVINDPSQKDASKETVLFSHGSFSSRHDVARQLNVAIRNAWLTLRESSEILSAVVDMLVTDSEYVTFLRRCGGIHNLSTV